METGKNIFCLLLDTGKQSGTFQPLIREVFKTCKLKILGYKPRPHSENSILKQTEMNAKFSKECFNAVLL